MKAKRGKVDATSIVDMVAAGWAAALEVPAVDLDANFFALGGDSLTAMHVLGTIQDELGVPATFADLLQAPELGAFVDRISKLSKAGTTRKRRRTTPLTPVQHARWQGRRGNTGAEVFWVHEIEGALNVDALGRAVDALVRRHEILRTVFPRRILRPRQVVTPFRPGLLRMVDLTKEARQQRLSTVVQRIVDEDFREFDFERGPLFRATLVTFAPRRHVFSIAGSEMVVDASVRKLVVDAVSTLYELYDREGSDENYPYPRAQYSDYAQERRALVPRSRYHEQLFYWREKVRTTTAGLSVPGMTQPPSTAEPRDPPTRSLQLDGRLVADVRRTARALSTTPFNVLAAGFVILVHAVADVEVPTFTTTLSHRDVAGADDLVGSFYNNVLVVVPLRDDIKCGSDLVVATAAATGEAFRHGDVPLSVALRLRKDSPAPSQLRTDSVRFQLHTAAGELRLPRLRVRPVQPPWTPVLDFYVAATETDAGGLDLYFSCRHDVPRVVVDNSLAAYRRVVRAIVDDPGVPLDRLLRTAREALRR